jgi:hypothetical protein
LRKAGEDPFGGQAARSAGRSSICCWWRETPRRRASCRAQSRTSRKNSRS